MSAGRHYSKPRGDCVDHDPWSNLGGELAMSKEPVAFMSHVRADDAHDTGRLTQFCERLSSEVRMQTGEEFPIFQDRKDIAWGQQWKARIEESLDTAAFLIPIITPGFFKSQPCRDELERFLDREKKLGRRDLVFPVYYVTTDVLDEESKRSADPLASELAARQHVDWRELRFETSTAPAVGKTLAAMARQIMQAMQRGQTPPQSSSGGGKASRPLVVRPSSGAADAIRASAFSMRESAPTAKTEPRTLVVDALHRGDHTSLTAALQAAQPGDRILVRPGNYCEGVVIEKVVEIIGDGEVADIVITASGSDTIRFRTTMGRIANLTLRQTGGEDFACVDIAQGRVDIEACDISSQSFACVAIHDGADPRMRRNRIHHGQAGGIVVHNSGQGTIEDNDIFANDGVGVGICSGGAPTLRRNRIHDNTGPGVYIWSNGQGTVEDNDVLGNEEAGVEIEQGGAPAIRRNRISRNGSAAVWIHDGGRGIVEDNDLRGNRGGAWHFDGDAWDFDQDSAAKVKRGRNQE